MLGDSFKLPTRINILLPKNTDLLLVQKFIEVKNCPLQDHHLISNDSQFSTFHFWRIRAFFGFNDYTPENTPSSTSHFAAKKETQHLSPAIQMAARCRSSSSFQKVIFLSDTKKITVPVFVDKKTAFFGRPGGCVFPHRSPGVFSTHQWICFNPKIGTTILAWLLEHRGTLVLGC